MRSSLAAFIPGAAKLQSGIGELQRRAVAHPGSAFGYATPE
jgi:hypothetical protein